MNRSQLHDFHPAEDGFTAPILQLAQEYGSPPPRRPGEREQFLALLAGVPALRKTPGITGHDRPDYFTTLPRCTPEESELCQKHLENVFGITGQESLLDFCAKDLQCQSHYLDFESFWEGRPSFDPSTLPEGSFFTDARDFAAQFYDLVGRGGFLGWDISECVGHLRSARACGLLSEDAFNQLAEPWIDQAQVFHSWTDYAVSFVCGALYWDFRHGSRGEDLQKGLALWLRAVRRLLDDENAWGGGLWYVPPRKKDFCLWPAEMRPLLRGWTGPEGCFATDQITVEGKRVGWCYRETPDERFPDSGWRFFSGEETEEYVAESGHFDIYMLNTLCNYDPDILPLLSAPYNSAFVRGEDGAFRPEPFSLEEPGTKEVDS